MFAAHAAEAASTIDGAALSFVWALPFIGILLSIALVPLISAKIWHHHFAKFAAFWAIAITIPLFAAKPAGAVIHDMAHTLLLEYLPFVILLGSLYIVAGGIRITGRIGGTPAGNTGVLAFGTMIASLIGTTGAAMVLIRPLIRANRHRRSATHVFVFFIFLVGNIGGSLTPLGDPPLFLGFLAGVEFFWFAEHLLTKTVFLAVILLLAFYLLERFVYFPREGAWSVDRAAPERISIEGGVNLVLLLGIVGAVLMSGTWKSGMSVSVLGIPLTAQSLLRDAILMVIAIASLRVTKRSIRQANEFDWFPIREVAILFFAIFLTMIPVLAMLKAGPSGPMAAPIALTEGPNGPEAWRYFWITGLLSGVLDNAPTFLVFFNVAGGDAAALMTEHAGLLTAISAGAVFMGALTYIGNAPNFLIRSVVESQGVRMPSFLGYMVWSFGILVPLFVLLTLVFLR